MAKNVNKNPNRSFMSVPNADPSVVEALNEVLGNEYALSFEAQLYRWNVVGPISSTLTSKFSKQCKKSAKAASQIGNRIRTLNPNAPVNFGQFQPLRAVTQQNSIPASWEEMVSNLIVANQNAIEPCRNALQAAQSANDTGTAFLLMKHISSHEKAILKLGNLVAGNSQSIAS